MPCIYAKPPGKIYHPWVGRGRVAGGSWLAGVGRFMADLKKNKKPASEPSPPTLTRPGAFILRSGHPLSLINIPLSLTYPPPLVQG